MEILSEKVMLHQRPEGRKEPGVSGSSKPWIKVQHVCMVVGQHLRLRQLDHEYKASLGHEKTPAHNKQPEGRSFQGEGIT